MELKLIIDKYVYICHQVLIVPLWNWNTALFGASVASREF
mgnify:CR=1 FL=1